MRSPSSRVSNPVSRRSAACAASSTLIATALLLGGCQLLDQAAQHSSCTDHSASYTSTIAQEGALSVEIPTDELYPMAMVISQPAINKLFAAVAGANIPDIVLQGEPIPFVPVKVTISPQLPLLQIGGERECPTCLLTDVGFGLEFDVDGLVFGGAGNGRYQFPLFMSPVGQEATSFYAQLDRSEVLSIDLSINGVNDTVMNFFEPLIANAVTNLVRNEYGDTHLFDLKAWEMGDGDVKLLGRGPHISPENETIVIGMHSNLVRPLGGSVNWTPSLPEGADIGLQFHPELVQSMVSRMMHEGHVPRSYDASGQAQTDGEHQVTLNTMASSGSGLMTTNFRLWRTAGGFCGFADLQADLGLSISDKQLTFNVDNVKVTDSAGAGDLLRYTNDWVGSDYLSELASVSQLTVNYNEMEIPGGKRADMSAESFRLDLGADGLSLFLNIDQIVDAAVN